jgi:hypothetical protein
LDKLRRTFGRLLKRVVVVAVVPVGTGQLLQNRLAYRQRFQPWRFLRELAGALVLSCRFPEIGSPRQGGLEARFARRRLRRETKISITLTTYWHVAPEVSRDAADRIEGALWRDRPWLLGRPST